MNLSKEELLEKAKRDYGPQVRFKGFYSDKIFESAGVFSTDRKGSIRVKCNPRGHALVYHVKRGWLGQWAEILPEENLLNHAIDDEDYLTNDENLIKHQKAVIDHLTQELKEAKEYITKVDGWGSNIEENVLTIIQTNYALYKGTNEAELHSSEQIVEFFKDQFKQIK